jgi:catechol 2,3-dioxygenase-like lactoylglutathione lyase family enzyme
MVQTVTDTERAVERSQITRIDHGAVPVNDGGRAWAFYTEVLGAKLHRISHMDNQRFVGQGPLLFIELAGHRGFGLALEYETLPPPQGIFDCPVWAFRVSPETLGRAPQLLHPRGITSTLVEGPSFSPIARSLFFRDTEGNSLELCVPRGAVAGAPGRAVTATDPSEPLELEEISHVRLTVTDMEAAERYYTEVLGLVLMGRAPDGNELVYGLRNGEQFLILQHGPAPSPRSKYIYGPHVAVDASAQDYHELRARLDNKYIEYYWGRNNRIPVWHESMDTTVYFYDPDGNRLQVQMPRAH